MRIVTWNCCRGPFDKKMAALESLRPDIAIIAETMAPEVQTDQLRWFPSNLSRLGMQVRAFNGYRLARVRKASAALPNCVSPVRVTHVEGRADFSLLAVWTWPAPSYSQALLNGLAAYARLLKRGPAIVAGDFNGSPFFERPTARVKRWALGFEQLHAAGLSAPITATTGWPTAPRPRPRITSCASRSGPSTSISASCRRPGQSRAWPWSWSRTSPGRS